MNKYNLSSRTVKAEHRPRIQSDMTYLNLNTASKLSLCWLLAVGCSSHIGVPGIYDTGGTGPTDSTAGGATSITNGQGGAGGNVEPVFPGLGGAGTGGTDNAAGGLHPLGAIPEIFCTPETEQICSDNPTASPLMGHCDEHGVCVCATGFVRNPKTSKCNTPEQSNCYSPTQNIDIALSTGAEGCFCDTANSATNCVQDSFAHTMMFTCTYGKWQAVAGGNCM